MRKVAFGLVLLAIVVAAGWTAAWFYAAHEAGRQFDAWLKSEDGQGRDWTCPERTIDGYPFAIAVRCTHPTFTGHAPDQTVDAEAAGAVAEVSVLHPDRVSLTLQSPLTYKSSDQQAVLKATWSRLAITLEGLSDLRAVDLHGDDLAVDGNFGQSGRQGGNAEALDARFSLASEADQQPALDFAIAVRGTAVPPLDDLLGGQAPVDLDVTGRLTRAATGDASTPNQAIEHWRQSGGQIVLGPSSVTRGDSRVAGSGTLRLDQAHRLQGRLDASFVGLEPILKRYGISGNLAAAGSLLSTLFGGGRPRAPATPGALNLPISFQNGYLGIGPIRTQIALQPLY